MSHKIGSGLCVFRKGCVMNLNRIHGWGFLFSSVGTKASSQFLSLKGTHCAVQLDCESERGGWVSVQEGVRDGEKVSDWLQCAENSSVETGMSKKHYLVATI